MDRARRAAWCCSGVGTLSTTWRRRTQTSGSGRHPASAPLSRRSGRPRAEPWAESWFAKGVQWRMDRRPAGFPAAGVNRGPGRVEISAPGPGSRPLIQPPLTPSDDFPTFLLPTILLPTILLRGATMGLEKTLGSPVEEKKEKKKFFDGKQFQILAMVLIRTGTVGAILWAVIMISLRHWPTKTAGEFAQMVALLAGTAWLSIGILRRRVLGLVRRAFYDTKNKNVEWKTVGLVFRWKYDSECHGKLIDVPASTTREIEGGGTRTDNQRSKEIVRQHYLTIACWVWRKPPVNALPRISVCGYTFRIGRFVADTPVGIKYPMDLNRSPHNFSLADVLELREQLARLLTIVRNCEQKGHLATARGKELLDEVVLGMTGWRKPFYGDLIYCLRVLLPDHFSPQYDDLTARLREKGSEVVEDAITRNDRQIGRKVALLSRTSRDAGRVELLR